DERRLGMFAKQVVALGHELVEARKAVGGISASGEERQLEPALVAVVDRLEELLRIRRVNEHRNPEPCAGVPERIQRRIVERETRAICLRDREAEALRYLSDAHRTGGHVRLQLRHRPLCPTGSDVTKIDSGEHEDSFFHWRPANGG